MIVIKNMADVYRELEVAYNKITDRKKIGESMYLYSNYLANNINFINSDNQDMIKKYYYSKLSKTPPYPSVQDTPDDFIDDFIIIDEECNALAQEKENK
tara:strand:+ start:957 stop:1253 length:297 start_codon:yes stop_codon:yes gene_type:complete